MKDDSKTWSRFCWFAFDDVDTSASGWREIKRRNAISQVNAETVVRELEALLILVLGSRNQNQMNFIASERWEQITLADCQAGQALTKVDRTVLLDWKLRRALEELD